MIPDAYVANPLADVSLTDEQHIDVAAYSRLRGFVRGRLTRDETPGFAAALQLLEGGSNRGPLSPIEVMALWQVGLIMLPQECAEPFVAPVRTLVRDHYVRHGFAVIPELITTEAVRILCEHYRVSVAAGKLALGDAQANRHYAHNDPAGRVVLNALRGTVERIVGRPVKSSYVYVSLYVGGTELRPHRDRPQCRYTVSLQLDHQPLPSDGCSPWPVQLYLNPDSAPVNCFQAMGGGVLFRGCEILHGRPMLSADQQSWVLLLHYVDAEFAGSLN